MSLKIFVSAIVLLAFASAAHPQKKAVRDTLYKIIESSSIEAALQTYKTLKLEHTDEFDFGPQQLMFLAFKLDAEGQAEQALKLHKLNSEVFPENVMALNFLGQSYLSLGKNQLSIETHEKVLLMLADAKLPDARKKALTNSAKSKILQAKTFEPASKNTLNYISFYGGGPAGAWDVENLVSFNNKNGGQISYHGSNLYTSPVPFTVPPTLWALLLAVFIATLSNRAKSWIFQTFGSQKAGSKISPRASKKW